MNIMVIDDDNDDDDDDDDDYYDYLKRFKLILRIM